MKILDALIQELRKPAQYNRDAQVAPACILWPDKDSQWAEILPNLQAALPELMILGEFNPEQRTGPAIWLRCVIAGKMPEITWPVAHPPIVYLPGISRQDLRALETCPDAIKPLAELQYRGVIWSQANSKDWTVFAFLKTETGGLGLDVAQDNETKVALQMALHRVLEEESAHLTGKRLDKDFFNTLMMGGDPIKDLLQWLDQPESFKAQRSPQEWRAFVEVCKSQLRFHPEDDGILAGAERLATREGPWKNVWERFCEAPNRYPLIPEQIGKCQTPQFAIFSDADSAGSWPQWNQGQEKTLETELLKLKEATSVQAREIIFELEEVHGPRRKLVWAELGEASLALALKHLHRLAQSTRQSLAVGTLAEIETQYQSESWQADDAVIQALAAVEKQSDLAAITAAIRALYLPWAEDSARHLQKLVAQSNDLGAYPGGSASTRQAVSYPEGECVLFVDGLRFDTAKHLKQKLQQQGFDVAERPVWTTLPSVTATGKAAVTPVHNLISGPESSTDFEPCVLATGQSLKGGYHLKKLLKEAGWQNLERSDAGDGKGHAWCEFGDIDSEGHDRGAKLARHLPALLTEIAERIANLHAAGWQRVRVVTDHGWLLMPGGLPKVELPSVLTDSRWGRCAAVKPGASIEDKFFPWYWNPLQSFALADGISCYKKGEEYSHGGLSLQECLNLELLVTSGNQTAQGDALEIDNISWQGLRCKVAIDGSIEGVSVDIRRQAGNPDSSVVRSVCALKANGTASVVVEDEDLEGQSATLVLIDQTGRLLAQQSVVIGRNEA